MNDLICLFMIVIGLILTGSGIYAAIEKRVIIRTDNRTTTIFQVQDQDGAVIGVFPQGTYVAKDYQIQVKRKP